MQAQIKEEKAAEKVAEMAKNTALWKMRAAQKDAKRFAQKDQILPPWLSSEPWPSWAQVCE